MDKLVGLGVKKCEQLCFNKNGSAGCLKGGGHDFSTSGVYDVLFENGHHESGSAMHLEFGSSSVVVAPNPNIWQPAEGSITPQGNFALSAQHIRLIGAESTILIAQLMDVNGFFRTSFVHLNFLIGNENGVLVHRFNGGAANFHQSSRWIRLTGPWNNILEAECRNAGGGWQFSAIDLNTFLGNDNGRLRYHMLGGIGVWPVFEQPGAEWQGESGWKLAEQREKEREELIFKEREKENPEQAKAWREKMEKEKAEHHHKQEEERAKREKESKEKQAKHEEEEHKRKKEEEEKRKHEEEEKKKKEGEKKHEEEKKGGDKKHEEEEKAKKEKEKSRKRKEGKGRKRKERKRTKES